MASLWVLYFVYYPRKIFFVSPEKLRKMSYDVMVQAGRHVKIVLWPAVLIKHINVEPKKHEIRKKCLGRPERNQFFTLGIKWPSSSGVCLSSMKVLHGEQRQSP